MHRAIIALLNPSHAEVAIARSRIAQEKATGTANIATLNKERDALIGQKIEIQKQLDGDSRKLAQVNIEMSRTVITATSDGIIFRLKLRNKSQTVRLGEEIAQIVPSDASIVMKAVVALGDKNKLQQVKTYKCAFVLVLIQITALSKVRLRQFPQMQLLPQQMVQIPARQQLQAKKRLLLPSTGDD